MIGHTGDVILRLVAWTFLPDFLTKRLVEVYTRLPMNRGKPAPQLGDHVYRRTFALVVTLYLAYNIFQASVSTPPNYYQILGVPITADENELKAAFRNFARKNHPDRAGPGAEPLFIAVRDAYDGLRQPVKRFAYDRFGPDIFAWDSCSTPRDFVASGLLASSGFYIGSSFFMLVFKFIGSADSGSFVSASFSSQSLETDNVVVAVCLVFRSAGCRTCARPWSGKRPTQRSSGRQQTLHLRLAPIDVLPQPHSAPARIISASTVPQRQHRHQPHRARAIPATAGLF